jgi:hypothetical protein
MFTWKEHLLLDHMSDVYRALEGRFPEPLSVRSNSPTVKGERWVCVIERSTAAKILCFKKKFQRRWEVTPLIMVFKLQDFQWNCPSGHLPFWELVPLTPYF